MTYTMFIDDLREPLVPGDWDVVVRSCDAVFDCIAQRGCPTVISFDHDLGADAPTGYDIVKRLVEMDMNGELQLPDGFKFYVHSMNPVGSENIRTMMSNYIAWKGACQMR